MLVPSGAVFFSVVTGGVGVPSTRLVARGRAPDTPSDWR